MKVLWNLMPLSVKQYEVTAKNCKYLYTNCCKFVCTELFLTTSNCLCILLIKTLRLSCLLPHSALPVRVAAESNKSRGLLYCHFVTHPSYFIAGSCRLLWYFLWQRMQQQGKQREQQPSHLTETQLCSRFSMFSSLRHLLANIGRPSQLLI